MAKKRSFGGLIVLGLVVIAVGAGAYVFIGKNSAKPPEVVTIAISKGDVIQSVTATGVLQAPTSVDVSSQISGQIKELNVDYNQPVKKGDVLARIDPATYESRLRQAEANLASVTASNTLARLNADRTRKLRSENLVSQQELDQSEAQLSQSNAALLTAKATVEDARVNLDRCTIYAPIDGIVLDRQCDVGKTVAASLNAPTLFTLVTDLSKMQISADVAEADIGSVAIDQDVTFSVDAYPGRTFNGRVAQIRNLPKTSQSVVVYSTIIEVNNESQRLKPGMTANVSVIIAKRTGVLKIANAALRARIPEKFLPAKPETPATANNSSSSSGGTPTTSSQGERQRGQGGGGDGRSQFAQLRQLAQEAGVTFGRDMSAADREKIIKLAAERGIELPERFTSGGRNRSGENTVTTRTVYRLANPLPDLKVEPVSAKFGITDGASTEIIDGLKEGDVIVSSVYLPGDNAASAQPQQARNPFGGQAGPGGGGRRF
ncbi:MAG: efflux RND transporter periplasmic adaptor subunit [Nibricoccus sp.]